MTLRATDMARIEVDSERCALERKRMEREAMARDAERDLRRKERASNDKLELENFCLMIETLASSCKYPSIDKRKNVWSSVF